VLLPATPFAVALPGELWLAAGALVWPLGAWVSTMVRKATGVTRARIFARTAALATLVAVILLAAAALLFTINGSTRAFQALAAQLAAGASLLGGLLSGVIALTLRRATHVTHGPGRQPHQAPPPDPEGRAGEERTPPGDR
jgi:hypothetical protein